MNTDDEIYSTSIVDCNKTEIWKPTMNLRLNKRKEVLIDKGKHPTYGTDMIHLEHMTVLEQKWISDNGEKEWREIEEKEY